MLSKSTSLEGFCLTGIYYKYVDVNFEQFVRLSLNLKSSSRYHSEQMNDKSNKVHYSMPPIVITIEWYHRIRELISFLINYHISGC